MTSETNRPIWINQLPLFFLFAGFICALFFTGVEGRLFFFSQTMLWLFTLSKLLHSPGRFWLPFSGFSILLTSFIVFSTMTLFWSAVPGYTQTMLWRQGAMVLLFYSLLLFDDNLQWKAIRGFVSMAAIATISAALWQYVNGQQPEATFLNRNSLAGFLLPLLFWTVCCKPYQGVNWLYRILLFTGALLLGVIGSRGAFLAVGAGVVVIIVLSRYYRIKIHLWRSQAVVFGLGLVCSFLKTGADQGLGRLSTLQNPWDAGESRLLIWKSSLEIFKDVSWHGLGVGTYGLVYPQYRSINDGSAGHFAHNDLLQIGIETGFFGVLLCLLICVSFAVLINRSLKEKTLSQANKGEILALAAGLFAVFFHSLFTFNLYVYSTLLVIGIVLARLYYLVPNFLGKMIRIDLAKYGILMKFTPFLICFIPLFLILSGFFSQMNTQKAFGALEGDQSEVAVRYLEKAKRFWPSNDFNWYMEGEIVRLGLHNNHNLNEEKRADLFSLAEESFEKAALLNPWRPMTPHKLGLLLKDKKRKTENQDMAEIEGLYRDALTLDPRYFPARLDLAHLYASMNQHDKAADVLEEGLQYHYIDIPDMIPYLRFTGYYRQQEGDAEGFKLLKQRIERIKNKWAGKK